MNKNKIHLNRKLISNFPKPQEQTLMKWIVILLPKYKHQLNSDILQESKGNMKQVSRKLTSQSTAQYWPTPSHPLSQSLVFHPRLVFRGHTAQVRRLTANPGGRTLACTQSTHTLVTHGLCENNVLHISLHINLYIFI